MTLVQFDKIVQENASASEELASTSEELASQAESLQATISYFKVKSHSEYKDVELIE
jgi:methyl-accepting chemotaxis protein